MEVLLFGLIVVVMINIGATLMLFRSKSSVTDIVEETDAIYDSMGKFVADLEMENNELYHKLVDYIREKDRKLDERIQFLEGKLDTEILNTSTMDHSMDLQYTQKQLDAKLSNDSNREVDNVSQLFKQGFSPKQIAKVLQMDNGEVELVVNMLRTKHSYHR